jgi:hypothetical protein
VLDVHLLVAVVAVSSDLIAWFVRVVTIFAGDRVVHGKPCHTFGFERPVAARAVPLSEHLGFRAEDVAGVAIHRHAIEIDMGQGRLLLVALGAQAGVRRLERIVLGVVTFVACHALVDDVLCVPL